MHGYPSDSKGKRRTTDSNGGGYTTGRYNSAANVGAHDEQQAEKDPSPSVQGYKHATNRSAGIMFTQEQYEQLLKLMNKNSVTDEKRVTCILYSFIEKHNIDYVKWIVDSGAPNQMLCNKKLLSEIKDIDVTSPRKVHLPNGNVNEIAYVGLCDLEGG